MNSTTKRAIRVYTYFLEHKRILSLFKYSLYFSFLLPLDKNLESVIFSTFPLQMSSTRPMRIILLGAPGAGTCLYWAIVKSDSYLYLWGQFHIFSFLNIEISVTFYHILLFLHSQERVLWLLWLKNSSTFLLFLPASWFARKLRCVSTTTWMKEGQTWTFSLFWALICSIVRFYSTILPLFSYIYLFFFSSLSSSLFHLFFILSSFLFSSVWIRAWKRDFLHCIFRWLRLWRYCRWYGS